MKISLMLLCISLFTIEISVAQNLINEGSGFFKIQGNGKHKTDSITVFYHKPKNFNQDSKVLIVIPGAGRNGDDYRNSWVDTSEKYSFLIISPAYPEKEYGYGDYHLGGMVSDLNLSRGIHFKQGTNQVHIDESVLDFKVNHKKEDWIFMDFDRIFDVVKKDTKSLVEKYDLFGHSAGGQILHRLAMFHPNSKAERILASNAGTYTLPNFGTNFPFGVANLNFERGALEKSFNKKLVLFLGELDNDTETRGRMLRSTTADKQGTNRLDRGMNFFSFSKKLSKDMGIDFKWKLEIIANTGHDQVKMAEAAAEFLYN